MDANPEIKLEEPPVRLLISCDMCRQRKIKCDGSKPSCGRCLKMKVNCHYSPITERRKARKTQPLPKCSELIKGIPLILFFLYFSNPTFILIHSLFFSLPDTSISEIVDIHKEIGDLLDKLKDISLNSSILETLSSYKDSSDISETPYFSETPLLQDVSQVSSNTPLSCDFSSNESNSLVFALSSIDLNNAKKYISSFFSSYHPYTTGLEPSANSILFFLYEFTQLKNPQLISAILAAGSLAELRSSVLHNPTGPSSDFETLYKCLKNSIPSIIENPSIQSIIILNILATIENKLNVSQIYSSIALRMCFRLGLDKPSSSTNPNVKNLFWASLLTDSISSWTNGETPMIDFSAISHAGSSHFNVLIILFLHIYKKMHTESVDLGGSQSSNSHLFAQLLLKLDMWYKSLPETMRLEKINNTYNFAALSTGSEPQLAANLFLHCLYHALVIVLNQNYSLDLWNKQSPSSLTSLDKCSSSSHTYSVSDRSLISAGIITDILPLIQGVAPFYHFYGLGTCVYIGGLVYIECIISNNTSSDLNTFKSLLSKNISFLELSGEIELAQKLSLQARNVLQFTALKILDSQSVQASVFNTFINPSSSEDKNMTDGQLASGPDINMGVGFDAISFTNVSASTTSNNHGNFIHTKLENYMKPEAFQSDTSSTVISSDYPNTQLFKDNMNFNVSQNRNIDDIISCAFSNFN
ncbi:hypothetical protein BB560_003999 [Smittium megazygosporum]|uniref:Zn(2)-C6 fungal-type domain-containing protein n=1 Tax=Smittium megazygosporum TaxID=133381 RepID=A0A2T9ZAL4_9FUNG|nr:hypothetical protein BB560_003999 [Smittium megazygosporum]